MFIANFSLKSFVQRSLGHIQFLLDFTKTHPAREMQLIAFQETMVYVKDHMRAAAAVYSNREILDHALASSLASGHLMEFGVFSGGSVNHIARRMAPRLVHGFDSFEGLPEAWIGGGTTWNRGAFDRAGALPKVRTNVRLHKGLFSDTLPEWLKQNPGPVAFVHVDCDLYSSTQCVLTSLASRFVPGTVLLFDEYFNYPNWQQHEFKAFQEFVAQHRIRYEYLGYARIQAAVRLTDLGTLNESGTKDSVRG